MLLLLLLIWNEELLLALKVLPSTHNLTWIAYLVVVLIVLMLLYPLVWVPTPCFTFVSAALAKSFVLKRLPLLMLHNHFMILGISDRSHIGELCLLHLIRRRMKDNLLWRHHKLRLVHLRLHDHHLRMHHWLWSSYKLASNTNVRLLILLLLRI
jgi:hypothetical protein